MEKYKEIVVGYLKEFKVWFIGRPKWHKITAGAIGIFMIALIAYEKYAATLIRPVYSNEQFRDFEHGEVVDYLQELGFRDVKTIAINDLDQGATYDRLVEEVSINGKTGYDKKSRFSANVPIIVSYHSFSENAINFSKANITGDKEKIKTNLSKLGFADISFEKIEIANGRSSDLDKIEILINGESPDKKRYYDKYSEVKIQYSEMSPKAIRIKDFNATNNDDYSTSSIN